MKDVAFKTDDFVILAIVEYTPIGLAVKKGFKASTVKEFIEYAKANPGKVSCGGVGKFTGHHFATLQFMKMTGIKLNYVTFTGTAPVQTALMGGHIDAVFSNSTMMVSSREEIKVLAIGSEKRMNQLADVPTFKELGWIFIRGLPAGSWPPRPFPKAIQKRLEKAFLDTISKPEFRTKMEPAGFVPQVWGIEDSQKYLDSEAKVLHKLIQDFDLLSTKN